MNYKKPPIVEAVIEIRIAEALSQKTLDKLNDKFIRNYPSSSRIDSTSVKVDTKKPKEPVIEQRFESYKLSANDIDTAVIKSNALVVGRLTPYTHWDDLLARVERDWSVWKDVAGHKNVDRLGIRYINRIDVPLPESKLVRIEDYFTLYVNLVDPDASIGHYSLQLAMRPPGREDLLILVNAGTTAPAILDHSSFLLDIDVGYAKPPQSDSDILVALGGMRVSKNEAFESFITDKARTLFNS